MDISELDQSNGKWVLFDVRNPADRILDREILPDVQKYCDVILKMDADYLKTDPSEFVDDKGERWQRMPK